MRVNENWHAFFCYIIFVNLFMDCGKICTFAMYSKFVNNR